MAPLGYSTRWTARFLASLTFAAQSLVIPGAWGAAPPDVDVLRAALGGAAARIVAARIAIAEYYVTYNRPPTSSQEVGLGPASSVETVGISIESAGVIRLAVAQGESLSRLRVFLVPRLTPRGLAWSCVSPDIAAIATILRDCRFDATYEPKPETPATLEAKANPDLVIVTIEGRSLRIVPSAYISGSTATIDPGMVPGLSAHGREDLIDAVLTHVQPRIARLDDLLYLAAWLKSVAPVGRLLPERHLQGDPPVAAAALLALCDVRPRLLPQTRTEPCAATTMPQAAAAIGEINRRVEQQLHDPTDHPYSALRGIVDCHDVVAVVAALGPAARPVAASLGALLGDRRPHLAPGNVDLCKQRDIAVTLLRMLLTDPLDPQQADLADTAALALVQLTLFDPAGERDAKPAGIGALMDSQDMHLRLKDRLKDDIARWIEHCDQVQNAAIAGIGDLGVLGFDVVLPLLDARVNDPPCDPGNAAFHALTTLVGTYPREAGARFFETRAVPTRDDIITAALALREAGGPAVATDLDDLLTKAGVTAIEVHDGLVTFPGAPHLHWKPYDEWRVPSAGPAASTAGLQAAYRGFALRYGQCRIPVHDERIWLSVQRAKRLFVFPCGEDDPALLVIGSPAGFKAMRVPERLGSITFSPQDAIVGVGDADGDGNLEVLMVVPCDGRDPDCADGRVPDSYEFFEEDGDWFTWFRASGVAPAMDVGPTMR